MTHRCLSCGLPVIGEHVCPDNYPKEFDEIFFNNWLDLLA